MSASGGVPGNSAAVGEEENTADLNAFVEGLLSEMQQKFQQMSDQIIGRLDEMGQRVDELEHNITQLMQQVGPEDKDTGDQEVKREK
ncbi:heat shock factor-binding protein 1-like [Dysidea avara]|uniref:heat shock factor-binding protein 1-like n=1 Tax=Dysidea avara TaxID=196820 RepID=UPI00332712D6